MKNITIALFACLLLASQISCKKNSLDPPVDPPDETLPTLLAEDARGPAWSPNGKKIAYIYEESLYLMNSDGSDKHKLESDLYEYPAIWSPTGDYMLYTRHTPSTRWELIRIDANGDNKTILCGNTTNPHHASWSPDGQKIAFTTWNSTLSIMNSDGTNMHTLTEDVNTYQTPRWTPDMTTLMFTWGFDYDRDMYLINSDGSNLVRIANDSVVESGIQFSIDGTKVFFTGYNYLLERDIFSINCDGSGFVNLTSDMEFRTSGGPQLSPDGTKIAFASNQTSEYVDKYIYIMATDGSGKQRLEPAMDDLSGICWSPDGKEIAFKCTLNNKGGIYSVQVDQ